MPAGRFKDNPNYLPRFYTSPNFDALQAIRHRPLPSLQTLSLHTPPSFAPQAISAARGWTVLGRTARARDARTAAELDEQVAQISEHVRHGVQAAMGLSKCDSRLQAVVDVPGTRQCSDNQILYSKG